MEFRRSSLIVLFTCLGILSFGQNINPGYNSIYVQDELTILDFKLSETDKQNLIYPDDPGLDIYYRASLHLKNSKIDTICDPIGVRIRGNTSRGHHKKSFKVDFKEFGGEQVKKLKKLNLKPNNNDPSMLRESLSWLMYRKMNVPAARTAFALVYMNDEFMGVYQNVENIDDEFVDRRYGNEDGTLFKCTWGATLETDNDIYNDNLFEIKTNKEINDRSRLQELISLINQAVNQEWEESLESIFDVDNYLREMAVESMIGHWDGYSCNANNFYLYDDPETGKFHFIPYDLDNTWGIDWIGPDWTNEDLMNWYSGWLDVRLTKQILKSDNYLQQYVDNVHEVMKDWFEMENYAHVFQNVIKDAVADDAYYSLDYGFTYNDFLDAIENPWGGHVEYSIADYIKERYQNAIQQIPEASAIKTYLQNEFAVYPNPCPGHELNVLGSVNKASLLISDLSGNNIPYTIDGGVIHFDQPLFNGIYMIRNGNQLTKFLVRR